MTEGDAPHGWFGIPAPPARESGPAEEAAPDARAKRAAVAAAAATPLPTRSSPRPVAPAPTRSNPRATPTVKAPRDRTGSPTRIDIGILLIAGLVILSGLLEFLEAAGIIANGLGGRAKALFEVIGAFEILLGVGLLTRNELARRIYLVLAFIGLLLILLGSSNATVGAVIVNLIFQLIPIVFLMLSAVAAKFE
jgi:hypothetical protein